MCPAELAHNTFEYEDHYVIAPAINFSSRTNDFTINKIKERGKPVESGFEYSSDTNERFLNLDQILEYNQRAHL